VSPEEIKSARKQLACTAKELANALGVEQRIVMAWESGDLFPTKAFVEKIEHLCARGPSAIPKKAKGPDPMHILTDPAFWELFRKLAVHKRLREEVLKLASTYDDPALDRDRDGTKMR